VPLSTLKRVWELFWKVTWDSALAANDNVVSTVVNNILVSEKVKRARVRGSTQYISTYITSCKSTQSSSFLGRRPWHKRAGSETEPSEEPITTAGISSWNSTSGIDFIALLRYSRQKRQSEESDVVCEMAVGRRGV